jgi:amino acid adenylation domain-containing protein
MQPVNEYKDVAPDEQAQQIADEVFVFPASFAQQRLWFLDKLEPGQGYNVPFALRLTGQLRPDVLERALGELVARHEVLRTTFSEDDSGKAIQLVSTTHNFALTVTDLSSLPAAARETEALRLVIEQARLPFDLKTAPLFRATLFRLAVEDHVLSLAFHHSIVDGGSFGILLRELAALYEAFEKGAASPLKPLPIQYGDYATWQHETLQGERLEKLLAYWKKALQGAPAVLDLPTDFPRPPAQTFNGSHQSVLVPRSVEQALADLSKKQGATPFMTLLASFSLLLSRYSGQEDLVVASPISGRTRAELEGLIGFFVNTLPLRADLSGNPSFRALLDRVRENALQAYAHQELPFEKLVEELNPERNLSHNPIVQVMFTFDSAPPRPRAQMGSVAIAPFRGAEGMTTKFDLSLNALQNKDGLTVGFTYNVDLFAPETVKRMLSHFCALLESVVANPDQPIANVDLLTEAEHEQQIVAFNATGQGYARDLCLHQLFERQVEKTPEAVAAADGNSSLTYSSLNGRANQLARYLQKQGVQPQTLVGICLDRSLDMLVAVLGVLKAGAAYVPLDPAYPKDRIAFVIEDSQASVLITQSSLFDTFRSTSARWVRMDADWNSISSESDTTLQSLTTPDGPAYVIYTSGSTGKPKGVEIGHESVVNFLTSMQREPGFKAEDTLLAVTTLSFDIAGLELHLPLSVGGKVVIATREEAGDGARLMQRLKDSQATVMQATPASWRLLLDAGWQGDSKLKILCGGEALPRELAEKLLPGCGELWNMYGPTETTIWSSVYRVQDCNWASAPIGRPIANTQMYVLNKNAHLVPLGVPGELHIAGDGLAHGYWKRPELTSQKFIPDPFSKTPGARMYKTGDLVRYLPDGNLQYLSRIDNQVKLRGFRIELGEIESVLAEHEAVAQAVVAVRESTPGNQQLVAYIVASQSRSDLSSQLREFLGRRLPSFMVPSTFVVLDAFPLTPNGKVDRRALPAPDFTDIGPVLEAGNEVEHLLVGIWKHLLSIETVGVTNNFFELGGHSLLATQMVSRIRRAFQVELPLRLLFEHPTIAELAKDIERLRRAEHAISGPKLIRQPRRFEKNAEGEEVAVFPVSFAEQRLWMLDRLQPNSSAYNLSIGLRLQGELKINALERSIEEILRRHEVLRARFRLNGDEPEQCIGPLRPVALPITVFSNSASPETSAREFLRKESQRTFDLANGPLWRASLVHLANDDHVLLITVHHIAFDGWSAGVLLRELAAHYSAFATGSSARLPELDIQYPDFSVWQREYLSGERLEKQVSYWKRQLAGAPGHIELPTDRPRPQMQTFRGSQMSLTIPPELSLKLKQLAHKNESTLFMMLLGAFSVLLARYSGQEDVVVGSPIAGRTHAETENLIGFFVNTIPLRASMASNPPFAQLLASVRNTTLDAYAHQDLPFEKLVEELKPERDLSRNPIFQVMFALQNVPREMAELPRLKLSPFRAGNAVNSKFDLSLMAVENGDSINTVFEYNSDLFEAERIKRMQRHWLTLLEGIVANPDCPVAELPLMESSERQQVLVDWNAGSTLSPSTLLHQFVEQQTARTPDAVALIDGVKRISYRELNSRANQLARKLQKLGVGPEVLVAVCSERCADMMVALLAVLKAGGAYVPLDPMYPKDRLAKILEDSHAKVMIAQEPLTSILPPHSAEVVLTDRDWPAISTESEADLEVAVAADNLAYVLFTSGSTGRPKGVALEHRSASIFVQWAQTVFTPEELSGTLFGTSICFDLSIFEMFVPLSVGGTVIIAQNALALKELSAASEVRLINTVPSAIAELLRMNAVPSSVLTVNLAGEPLPESLAREICQQTSVQKLYNLYGPTEDTTYSTYTLVPRSGEVTIGRPIANTQTYVLDARRQPVPIGVPGELYLAGDGLARGYYGRDDLTAERFVANPFSDKPNARMYRTGDRCRYRADGSIEYLGRIDNQVKLRGFRIELGEIESLLVQHPSVQQAVVVVREDTPGNPQLVAYVVATAPAPELPSQLRTLLSQSVPNYMVPSAILALEAFPLTPNGKIDRRALPAPDGNSQTAIAFVAPRTATEQALAAIWAEVLRRPAVGIHDDFFALGGHSLLATQVISRIQVRLQRDIPLRTLFERPTVEQLAKAVEEAVAGDAPRGKITPANRAAFRAKRT